MVLDSLIREQNKYPAVKENGLYQTAGYLINVVMKFKFFRGLAYFTNNFTYLGEYKAINRLNLFWSMGLGVKLWDILTLNLATNMIYDSNLNISRDDGEYGPALQFKHTYFLGIGFEFDNIEWKKKKEAKRKIQLDTAD
jgi:hypothetical protein